MKDQATQRLLLLIFPVCLLLFASNSQAQDHPIRSQYIRLTNKESVIVFVHGVLGDAQATWTNDKTKAFWPNLIQEDPFFNRFDIYVYSYSSPFRGAAYTVDELAEDMRRDMDSSDIFRKHKEVVFLCHSLGGIVVRAFLTRYRSQALQVPMIHFFSTPTTGGQIAELGRLLSNNPQLRTLLPMGSANDYLASIQKDWLAANFSIASYCAYETQDTLGVRVVGEANATNLCNRRLDPINANHIDMVKPRDRSDIPYVSFRNAVREQQERAPTKRPVPASSGAEQASPPRYHFAFDDSPGWTDQVKNAIGTDLNAFCIYLSEVGFEIPTKFPAFKLARFGAAEGKSPVQFTVSPFWGSRDVDLVSITIEYKLAADIGLARQAISEYLFSFYTGENNPKLGDWELRRQSMPILATYFNWSYAARNLGLYRPTPPTSLISWTDALWEMRTAFGQVYTDRVLYYGLKYMNQQAWPASTSFDIYFFDWAVVQGEWKEGSQHIKETVEILHKRGVNVWTYQPN